jgi:hypothetical protein
MSRCLLLLFCLALASRAEPPSVSYIFPAGGQRGSTVHFKIGGHYLHGTAYFQMLGAGITASAAVRETNTIWFEGPFIPMPASQQPENYPRDHAGQVKIDGNAPLGVRHWRVWTSQGATPAMKFVIGDLPEIIETEMDGKSTPVEVTLPITINGRIFPRENVDIWSFHAKAGETISCEVAAKEIGSPLEARLIVFDPAGREISVSPGRRSADPAIHFECRQDGLHQVRIHDLSYGGLQHYVYRLTLRRGPYLSAHFPLGGQRGKPLQLELQGRDLPSKTIAMHLPEMAECFHVLPIQFGGQNAGEVRLHTDTLPEHLENTDPAALPFTLPAIFNGRISAPGQMDDWPFSARKNEAVHLELLAARLGSPLDSVLAIHDSTGKELARNDDLADGQPDSQLIFKAPEDGRYTARITDRFRSRGGPQFSYRLRALSVPAPDFRLTFPVDAVTVVRGLPAKPGAKPTRNAPRATLRLNLERLGGFDSAIDLEVTGLPAGVAVTNTVIAAKASAVELQFLTTESTKIAAGTLSIRGRALMNGQEIIRTARLDAPFGAPAPDSVLLAIALPTPFSHIGDYILANHPRGAIYRRTYQIERNGFAGPLIARMADMQGRHLQGARSMPLGIPAADTRFEFSITFPPWMEVGRTSRSQLMLEGILTDHDGTQHVVSYTSNEQNDQMISVMGANLLHLEADVASVPITPGESLAVRLRVRRDQTLEGRPVRIELLPMPHAKGVRAQPLQLNAREETGLFQLEFSKTPGSFTAPITLRATTEGTADPHHAEIKLELAPVAPAVQPTAGKTR